MLIAGGLDLMTCEGPSQPKLFYDSKIQTQASPQHYVIYSFPLTEWFYGHFNAT